MSVSNEAARTLDLNGISERNEFNSSFEAVIELPPAEPADCAELLAGRGRQQAEIGRALAILAGGVPRDVVRLAELLDASSDTGAWTSVPAALAVAMHAEAAALRRTIIAADSAGNEAVSDGAKLHVFEALRDENFSRSNFPAFARGVHDAHWFTRCERSFERLFGEEWRRLIVRLTLAGALAASVGALDDQKARDAQRVFAASNQSATIAHELLEGYLAMSLTRRAARARHWRRRMQSVFAGASS